MKQIKITGGNTLSGTIKISGAKNSAVALIPAALLTSDKTTLCNIPNILDIAKGKVTNKRITNIILCNKND